MVRYAIHHQVAIVKVREVVEFFQPRAVLPTVMLSLLIHPHANFSKHDLFEGVIRLLSTQNVGKVLLIFARLDHLLLTLEELGIDCPLSAAGFAAGLNGSVRSQVRQFQSHRTVCTKAIVIDADLSDAPLQRWALGDFEASLQAFWDGEEQTKVTKVGLKHSGLRALCNLFADQAQSKQILAG